MVDQKNCRSAYAYPLKISSNRRFLTDSKGVPFLYNADTGWFLFDRLPTEEYDIYLDDRVSKDFNTIHIMAPWNHDIPNYYGEYPFLVHADVTRPNEAWWSLLDVFIGKAAQRGLLVNIVPLWLGYFGGEWYEVFMENEPEAYFQFGRDLGTRCNKYANVIWTIGGDHDPEDRMERLDALARGLKAANPDFLISAHTWENKSAADRYGHCDWLDLNATYTYFPEWNGNTHVYALSSKDYFREPVKPFILIESGYENGVCECARVEAHQVRREAYWSVLSGSAGFAYGNADIWPFNPRWREAMDDPGAFCIMHAFKAFHSRRWYELVPDFGHRLVVDGYGTFNSGSEPGGDDYICAAGTADNTLVMVYIPCTGTSGRTFLMDLSGFSGRAVKAAWYNPTDGSRQSLDLCIDAGNRHTITTPGDNGQGANDWLLIIEASDR